MVRYFRFILTLFCVIYSSCAADDQNYTTDQLASKIIELYNNNGYVFYNHNAAAAEVVTEMAHALQSAKFASGTKAVGDKDSIIAASLMHDIGHLLFSDFRSTDKNDHHDQIGGDFLEPIFGKEVSEPVRLHVAAKRYLCTVDKGYFSLLTPASQGSFIKQGKRMTKEEIDGFEQAPFHKLAIEVRKCDDKAKDPNMKTEDITYYRPLLVRLANKHLKPLASTEREEAIKVAIKAIDDAISIRKSIGRHQATRN